MATIQASIKLNDGMSPALRSMQKALNIVINSFESMQRASDKGINTNAIKAARAELAKTGAYFNKIEKEINDNTRAQNRFNRSVKGGTSSAKGLVAKIGAIAAAYLSFQALVNGAKIAVSTADQMTQTTARLNMINDGLQTTAELEEMIYQSAMRSRAGFMDTADAVAKLGLRAGDIFSNNAETIQFAETLNKMFVIAGASQAEMSAATLQLTQALGSGVLRGEEFNAVFEAAPNVMRAVADSMGVPIGQLRNLAAEGKISASIVKNALLNATADVNKQFESMPMTWAQVWTSIKNFTIKATQPILQAISNITKSERFIGFMNSVKNAIAVVARVLGVLFVAVQKVCAFIYDYWGIIEPILIAAALYYIPTMVAGLWAMVKPLLIAAATWLSMNWPILVIIALIAIVIAIARHMGVTFSEVCGFIGAVIGALAALIWDIIVAVYKAVTTKLEAIANLVITLCEVVYNAFTGGFTGWIAGVKSALWSFVGWAYSIIKPLVEVWDGIKGTNYAATLQKGIDNKIAQGTTSSYKKFDRVEWSEKLSYANPADWAGKGADLGLKLGKQTSDFFSGNSLNGLGGLGGIGGVGGLGGLGSGSNPALDNISNKVGDIASNTSDIAASNEDLDLMRDLAERDAINRYTMTDLKVEMTNNNSIASNMDLDKVVDYLQEKVYEGVLATAEGVHF